MDGGKLHERLTEFVRAFGLHHVDRTPCNQRMSVSEAHALSEVARHQPLSAGELAKRLRLEKSTVSRIIAHLQRRGWVDRTAHATDRRIAVLTLTPAGRQAESELAEARQARLESLVERIPAEERLAVLRGLDVLIGALDEQSDDDRTLAESGEDRR
jgi:DNA-binding MarR family transcriptional regulator